MYIHSVNISIVAIMMKLCGYLVVATAVLQLVYGQAFLKCPYDYSYDHETNRCFLISKDTKSWLYARDECRFQDADLLTVPPPSIIADLVTSQQYWVGLNDMNVDGSWRFNNAKENATDITWANHHPLSEDFADNEIDCAAIVKTEPNEFVWKSFYCMDEYHYVCERPTNDDLTSYRISDPDGVLHVTCPSDQWLHVKRRRLCITVNYDQMTWSDAMCSCLNLASGQANILNVADFDINHSTNMVFSGGYFWIAANDKETEGVYLNGDSRDADEVHYLPWKPGTTRSDEKDCVLLEQQGGGENKFSERDCSQTHMAICQYIPPLPVAQGKVCPDGWEMFEASETCFKVMDQQRKKWSNARDICKGMESDFAVIPDKATLDFLKEIGGQGRYWIGLHDKEQNGKFSWLGQDSQAEFVAWRNPPKNIGGDEYCVELIGNHDGRWNDKSCSAKKHFICQKDATYPY